jgi:hypothetical protein
MSGGGAKGGKQVKKVTGLAVSCTKEGDFTEWYTQAITRSEMIEYYDVSGCYILRPWSFKWVLPLCVCGGEGMGGSHKGPALTAAPPAQWAPWRRLLVQAIVPCSLIPRTWLGCESVLPVFGVWAGGRAGWWVGLVAKKPPATQAVRPAAA